MTRLDGPVADDCSHRLARSSRKAMVEMTKWGLVKDLWHEFSVVGFLFNRLAEYQEGHLVSFYRPISGRGRDQWRCLLAHLKRWWKTGRTGSYCHECRHFLRMTCMESHGYSEECRQAHWRFEAT